MRVVKKRKDSSVGVSGLKVVVVCEKGEGGVLGVGGRMAGYLLHLS